MPACYDETNYPVVFPIELEAQCEIADNQLTRIREFLDGVCDYDDTISTDEFVLPVNVQLDGSISTQDGRVFGRQEQLFSNQCRQPFVTQALNLTILGFPFRHSLGKGQPIHLATGNSTRCFYCTKLGRLL